MPVGDAEVSAVIRRSIDFKDSGHKALIVWLYKINDKIRAYSIISKILVQLQKNTALLSELLSVILYQKQLFSI